MSFQPRTKVSTTTSPPHDKIFSRLESEINHYNSLLESVAHFKEQVESGLRQGIFDNQDLEWIETDVQRLIKERDERVKEYERRKNLYDNSIVKMEDILNRRKEIIEETDKKYGVFKQRPELLKLFAQKRASLIRTVEQAKNELQQPI